MNFRNQFIDNQLVEGEYDSVQDKFSAIHERLKSDAIQTLMVFQSGSSHSCFMVGAVEATATRHAHNLKSTGLTHNFPVDPAV
jgi:hypothetical protein